MLRIHSINKFLQKRKILNNISMTVRPGEIALFIGKTGAGKSMFLRTLNNLEIKDSGAVFLNGQELINKPGKPVKIGMVFEKFNLFKNLTVKENIVLALENFSSNYKLLEKDVSSLLEKYLLLDYQNVKASNLSSGQKQLLAIARTVSLKPPVITFDKPTSALDPLLSLHVANIIQNLALEGYIILVASNDPALVKQLDSTIYLMHNGEIIEKAASKNKRFYPLISNFIQGKF